MKCRIELLEYYLSNNTKEFDKREGEHLRSTLCVNANVAGRTKREYSEEHRDRMLQLSKGKPRRTPIILKYYKKDWYDNSKKKINEDRKNGFNVNVAASFKRTLSHNIKKQQSIKTF